MVPLTVLYDASVLYPAPLRDFLMRLALTDLFRARWTADIHEEWMQQRAEESSRLNPRATGEDAYLDGRSRARLRGERLPKSDPAS